LIKRIAKSKRSRVIIETKARSTVILQSFVGLYFSVYTGKRYYTFLIEQKMVGRKLGEFSFTRRTGQIHKKRYRVIKKRNFNKPSKIKVSEKKTKVVNVKKKKDKKA
jgi:ribosomal protein S19